MHQNIKIKSLKDIQFRYSKEILESLTFNLFFKSLPKLML